MTAMGDGGWIRAKRRKPDPPELFDPATRERVRRHQAGAMRFLVGFVALLGAWLGAGIHHEAPFLAWMTGACSRTGYAYECAVRGRFDVVAGALGLALAGGLTRLALRWRRIPPTVRCESCGRWGWVMDLEPREGRCPRCAGSRFHYRTRLAGVHAGGGPLLRLVEERDADGAALVRRWRETQKSALDRYY
jgi:hypothetical protein